MILKTQNLSCCDSRLWARKVRTERRNHNWLWTQGIQDNSIFREHKKLLENPKPLGFEHREGTTFIFNFLSPQFFIEMLSMFLRPKYSDLLQLLGRKKKRKGISNLWKKKSHSFLLLLKLDCVKSAKSENGWFAATKPICQLETAPGLAGCGTACCVMLAMPLHTTLSLFPSSNLAMISIQLTGSCGKPCFYPVSRLSGVWISASSNVTDK